MSEWALFTFDRAGNTTVYVAHVQSGAEPRRFDERTAKLAADQINGAERLTGLRAQARPAQTLAVGA